jgi:hypothetical protein
MSRTPPAKHKRSICALVALILLCGGWFGWRVTCYNAGPQIRRVFTGARPHFDPVYSPDPTISAGIRGVIPSYFGMDESLGFTLIDSPVPLDLQTRFSRLSHLKFFSIQFTRCKIINLCPAASRGFPGFIVFDDCDFSELPAEQRQLLRPHHDPLYPKQGAQFCIGGV